MKKVSPKNLLHASCITDLHEKFSLWKSSCMKIPDNELKRRQSDDCKAFPFLPVLIRAMILSLSLLWNLRKPSICLSFLSSIQLCEATLCLRLCRSLSVFSPSPCGSILSPGEISGSIMINVNQSVVGIVIC